MTLLQTLVHSFSHPDQLLAGGVALFWRSIGTVVVLLHANAPKPLSDWLASAPQQLVAIVIGSLVLYLMLILVSVILRGLLRSVTFLVKSVVFSFVLVLVLYATQLWLMPWPSAQSPSHLHGSQDGPSNPVLLRSEL